MRVNECSARKYPSFISVFCSHKSYLFVLESLIDDHINISQSKINPCGMILSSLREMIPGIPGCRGNETRCLHLFEGRDHLFTFSIPSPCHPTFFDIAYHTRQYLLSPHTTLLVRINRNCSVNKR